jgi:hypothetical protein
MSQPSTRQIAVGVPPRFGSRPLGSVVWLLGSGWRSVGRYDHRESLYPALAGIRASSTELVIG